MLLPTLAQAAMPPKDAFSLDRLNGFAFAAVEKARDRLAEDGISFDDLSCKYLGVVTPSGSFDIEAHVILRCTIAYEWQVCAQQAEEKEQIRVQCCNASTRGVPFPSNWQTALKCQELTTLANDAAKEAADEIGREVGCKLIGIVTTSPQEVLDAMMPGTVIGLDSNGVRIPQIRCARVREQIWLCHRGSFEDGDVNMSNPFNEIDLVILTNTNCI